MKTTAPSERETPAIRKATPSDIPAFLRLVDALAEYEKLPPPDAAAKVRLASDLFGPRPRIEAVLGMYAGEPVGYAITFESYSSFLALPTLYLEDLFVLPEHRNRGIGVALFRFLVGEALKRGCGRMEWTVLDWNQLAIDFYRRLGATHMDAWQLFRLGRSEMETILSR